MRHTALALLILFLSLEAGIAAAAPAASPVTPACGKPATPRACLNLSLDAMGGATRLEAVKSFALETVGHTALVEQSYRQAPFITSYERKKIKVDLATGRVRVESHLTWPESDAGQAESDSTLVVGPTGGVEKSTGPDTPCSLSDLDEVNDLLTISPLRLLLAASNSSDLHFLAPVTIRSTAHAVLAFTDRSRTVRILVNLFNHLPDAVETTEQFHDHWYQWGDVQRRIYLDNFQVFHGVVYPTNQVEERNGILWQSTQTQSVAFNITLNDADFQMDPKAAELSRKSKGWDRAFTPGESNELAPGVRLFPGSWNTTLIEQQDGVVILESPISGAYTRGVVDEAKKRYPKLPVKAVVSTSDSWPHVGGVRQAVAAGVPVYILDLNKPLLDRLVAAPHTLHPDQLAQSPKRPLWRIVSGKTQVGTGANRVELYPLRGASTERQYMVYFPQHKLLYASDTLALNGDGSLYDPELMREVMQAVEREGLEVTTVFAMHQGPMPWSEVVALVKKALN